MYMYMYIHSFPSLMARLAIFLSFVEVRYPVCTPHQSPYGFTFDIYTYLFGCGMLFYPNSPSCQIPGPPQKCPVAKIEGPVELGKIAHFWGVLGGHTSWAGSKVNPRQGIQLKPY